MSDDTRAETSVLSAFVLFLVVAGLIGWDLVVDYREGVSWPHLVVELLVLAAAASGAVIVWGQLRRARQHLVVARVEAERWRQESHELLRGLGAAIQKQFSRWELTAAESEIGLLLLKGLSHKQIAGLRQTSERTVREQARSLYRKAGLSGRASLSAFFLEDLLLPTAADPEGAAGPGSETDSPGIGSSGVKTMPSVPKTRFGLEINGRARAASAVP
jgi:DNA-binding CsgD family transcriptional regulator